LDEEWQAKLVYAAAAGEAVVVEEGKEAYAVFSDSGLDAVREVVQFLRERGVEIPEVDVRRAPVEEEVRRWLRGVLKFLS